MTGDFAPDGLDVRIWKIRSYKGARRTTHSVRWRVDGREHHKTFTTMKLAETYRSTLLIAARDGVIFDAGTGLPPSLLPRRRVVTWYEHACNFVDFKWPHASPRHRKSVAEGLVTATVAELARERGAPPTDKVRAALMLWSFNTGARRGVPVAEAEPPAKFESVLRWVASHSAPVTELAAPSNLRPIVQALSLNLDGQPAAPSTVARKRSALFSALDHAVELELLPANPMTRVKQGRSRQVDAVDRRVVVNPGQAAALIEAVATARPSLEAFFAVMYYAGLRPAEARHLREGDITLPESGWGTLQLVGSTPIAGSQWTNSGSNDEDRELKHRAKRESRLVPAPPQLVAILRRHLAHFRSGPDGRLFVTRTGRAGVPLAGPYAKPQSMGTVYRVWDEARRSALTEREYA